MICEETTSRIIYANLDVGMDKYLSVGVHGPRIVKTREERDKSSGSNREK